MARNSRKSIDAAVPPVRSLLVLLRRRFSLAGFDTWATSFRSVVLNILFLIVVVVLVPLLIGQFSRDQVIIEPIGVPEALSDRGLTESVVANRIWDGLSDVKLAARTSKDTIASLPDSRRVEFSFPDSGLSIESLVFHIRKLFNIYETRIGGEFVCGDSDCSAGQLRLRLRVIRDIVDIVDLPPIGDKPERTYFSDAAAGILGILDPFVAIAAASETQPLKATILARKLIRSHHKDAKWAHNLIGIIRINAGDNAAAIEEFRAALALDQDFLPARANLGNSLFESGDMNGARQAYQEVRDRDPHSVLAAEGFAELFLAAGDHSAAVKAYLDAAEWAPVDPRYFTKAGRIEIASGNTAEGVKLLTRALELDPGYLPALAELGAMHLVKSDNVAAEKIYRNAADYSPDDAKAQSAHGRLLAILHDWAGAAQRYERASELAPETASYQREYAVMLQHLGRYDEALAQLETVARLTPDDPEIYIAMANGYRDTGRKAEAVAAYRRFLEVDKSDDPMRPIAERFIEILSEEN